MKTTSLSNNKLILDPVIGKDPDCSSIKKKWRDSSKEGRTWTATQINMALQCLNRTTRALENTTTVNKKKKLVEGTEETPDESSIFDEIFS